MITLASGTATVSDPGQPAQSFSCPGVGIEFVLDVTSTATDVTDSFDVYIQTMIDGVNWVDVVHFTQLVGTTGPKRYVARLYAGQAQAMFNNATGLGAALVRHILGDQWRVRWDIVDANANASFVYSVKATILGQRP